MGKTGQDDTEIRVRHPGVGNVLHDGGPGGADFRLRVVDPVSRNEKGS